MTEQERADLRRAIIAGTTDCGLRLNEAAALMGISASALRRSDCPRTRDVAGLMFLKSQCLLYIENRLTHKIEPRKLTA